MERRQGSVVSRSGGAAGRTSRRAGFTLLEVAIAAGVMLVVLGSLAAVYPALTSAGVETQLFLMAQVENDRARLALTDDLQTTDSTGRDAGGIPYFEIVNAGSGTANSIVFRRVEGFDVNVAEDIVTTRFGTPIRYAVDAAGNLLRTQDGQDRIVATHVSDLGFSIASEGCITVRITTVTGPQGPDRRELPSTVDITPRNVQKL